MSDEEDVSEEENAFVVDVKKVKLIQYMMLNRIVGKQSLISAYKSLYEDDRDAENMNDVLRAINEMLQGSKLQIRTTNCEVSGKPFYILVSSNYMPAKVWPTMVYSDNQLDFIRCLVHNIVLSDSGTLSLEMCQEIDSKLSKHDVPDLLERLISHKWLVQPRDDLYALSALSRAELEPYIQNVYKDTLSRCVFCKLTMFYGSGCSSCDERGHFLCLKKYKKSLRKGAVKCPSCNKNWMQSNCNSFGELDDEEMVE